MTMKAKEFHYVICDGCDEQEEWDDCKMVHDSPRIADQSAEAAEFKSTTGGQHYCPECWIDCSDCNATGDDAELNAAGERQACQVCKGKEWVAVNAMHAAGSSQ